MKQNFKRNNNNNNNNNKNFVKSTFKKKTPT